jgi:hypothetical protein
MMRGSDGCWKWMLNYHSSSKAWLEVVTFREGRLSAERSRKESMWMGSWDNVWRQRSAVCIKFQILWHAVSSFSSFLPPFIIRYLASHVLFDV